MQGIGFPPISRNGKTDDRIAFWVDLDTAYVTYKEEYVESVWWNPEAAWEKDLLFQGIKVIPYCPRCGTPLSDHEVALGYDEAVDPSIYVRLPLMDEEGTSLLVWTTTPWTLPGNVAVAAHPDFAYVKIEREMPEGGRERLILAKDLLPAIFGDTPYTILQEMKGKQLKGLRYKPLFTFLPTDKLAHYVVLADYVTTEDGSGLVHIAPAFGAEDMEVSLEENLPMLMTVAPDGTFISEVRPWAGIFVKDADPLIIQDLQSRGLMFHVGQIPTLSFLLALLHPAAVLCPPMVYRTSPYKDRMVRSTRDNW